MKITWVTRSFLDYRIPVYKEVNRLCGNQLSIIYYADVVPDRCKDKLKNILGRRAIGLKGEIRLGGKKIENQSFANSGGIRIPLRPGLIRKLRETKPDVILSDGFFQWTYAAIAANMLWKIPHVMCYERTLHTERNVTKFRTIGRKLASSYINVVCCNGVQTKDYLMKLGFAEDRLFIGNMAADYLGLQSSVKEINVQGTNSLKDHINAKGISFLYVGQLIPRKGIMELLKAWEEFSISLNPDAKLILVCGGEQENDVKSYISNHELKNVNVTGPVDYNEIATYYASADVFIIATLEDNWSLVVPEAMSVGLPIICSKYNGCWPELVKPENGWVFDPLEPEDFVQTLKEAWEKRSYWKAMGQKSLEIVLDFTPEKVANNIFNACLSVTGK